MDHYGLSLAVMVKEAKGILWVHNRHGGCKLSVLLRKQDTNLATVIHDLFGNRFHEEASEKATSKLITAPLPDLWLEAHRLFRA